MGTDADRCCTRTQMRYHSSPHGPINGAAWRLASYGKRGPNGDRGFGMGARGTPAFSSLMPCLNGGTSNALFDIICSCREASWTESNIVARMQGTLNCKARRSEICSKGLFSLCSINSHILRNSGCVLRFISTGPATQFVSIGVVCVVLDHFGGFVLVV
jgi:hypothetical protein